MGACVVDSGYDGEVFVNYITSVRKHSMLGRRQDCTTSADSCCISEHLEAGQAIFTDSQSLLAIEAMEPWGVQMDKTTQK